MHWWENVRLCIGSAKTKYTRGRCVGVWRLVVGMGPRRDLHKPYPRQHAGASWRFPIGKGMECTDNAVRIHSLDPRYLRDSGCTERTEAVDGFVGVE